MRWRFSLKIFLELLAIIVAAFFLEMLTWWFLLWVARVCGCEVFDPGLFKPPYVTCSDSLPYGDFLEVFMPGYMIIIGIPVFLLIISLFLGFYIFIPTLFVIAFATSYLLTKIFGNEFMKSARFPILIRTFFGFFKRNLSTKSQ